MADATFSVGLWKIALLIFIMTVGCSWGYFQVYELAGTELSLGMQRPGRLLAHLCTISFCSSAAIAKVLLTCQRRAATNRWAHDATEKILQPIMRVVIRDRRIQPAWNVACGAGFVHTDDIHGLTKFFQHNNGDALAKARFFSSAKDCQCFVAAVGRLRALRNKAHHKDSGSFLSKTDIEEMFADAQAVVSLIGSRPREAVEVWNHVKDWVKRGCGFRVGRYERAKRSLNKIQSQWKSEQSLIRNRN